MHGKIKPIVKDPDKILRGHAKEVPHKDISSKKIQDLIANMKTTLKHTPDGVGLAAPQLGKTLRIFIVSEEADEIDRLAKEESTLEEKEEKRKKLKEEKKEWKHHVFINPVPKNSSRRKEGGPEGCLSVPGKYGIVSRYHKLTVEAYDEHGKKFTRGASNFFARVMQHELDHLQGTLFIGKVEDYLQ